MGHPVLMYSFFSNRFHGLLGRNHLTSFRVVDRVNSFTRAINNLGFGHLFDQASRVSRLVLSDASLTDGLTLVTKGEATKLGEDLVLLNGHCLLEGDTDSGLGVGADVLGLLLFLGNTGTIFFSSHNDVLNYALISEGVHVHHAGVSLRHDRLVGK